MQRKIKQHLWPLVIDLIDVVFVFVYLKYGIWRSSLINSSFQDLKKLRSPAEIWFAFMKHDYLSKIPADKYIITSFLAKKKNHFVFFYEDALDNIFSYSILIYSCEFKFDRPPVQFMFWLKWLREFIYAVLCERKKERKCSTLLL